LHAGPVAFCQTEPSQYRRHAGMPHVTIHVHRFPWGNSRQQAEINWHAAV
jgi:hypothetical protein